MYTAISPKHRPRRSRSRITGLVVLLVCLTAGGVVVYFVATGGSKSATSTVAVTPLGEVFSLETDPLVVTDVRVVNAASDDAARDLCLAVANATATNPTTNAEWAVAGRNLNTTTTGVAPSSSGSAFVYLCMRQERVRDLVTSTNSTVLQSLRVLTASTCPRSLVEVFSPRDNVVLCAQTIAAPAALATGMYVSNVAVSFEPTYYRAVPGWTTERTDVAMTSNNQAYVSYKRPVRPISAVRVLSPTNASSTCGEQLGVQWEQTGSVGLQDSGTSSSNVSILCIERPLLNATQSPQASLDVGNVLVDVVIVRDQVACSVGFSERQDLATNVGLCSKFAASTTTTSYVHELRVLFLDETLALGVASSNKDALRVVSLNANALVVRNHTGIDVPAPESAVPLTSSESKPSSLPPLTARVLSSSSTTVAPSTDGLTFKIVQLADLHYTGDASHECRNPPKEMLDRGEICSEAATTAFVEQVLDAEQPDFVVFTGDNVEVLNGQSIAEALAAAVGPVEKRKIPYAWVFGNHDDENGQTRADMAQRLIGRPLSYMQWGPRALSGVGNYELSVEAPRDGPWGAAGSKVFQMYLLDSHAYADTQTYPGVKSTYDWIKPDQVAYYKELATANRLSSANASALTPLPAVMFFHIPIPEYANVGSAPSSALSSTSTSVAPAGGRSGEKSEMVSSSEINSNLFSALVEMGDVKATFVGHDHTNDYCVLRQGVQLCFGGGAGFAQAYGSASFARRSRVIEWRADGVNNKKRITSWKRHYGSAFGTRQHEETLFDEV